MDIFGIDSNGVKRMVLVNTDGSLALSNDSDTGFVVTLDYVHHEIHEGDHYIITNYDDDVDNSSPKRYCFVTPNTSKRCHAVFNYNSGAGGVWKLYEGATFAGAGNNIGSAMNSFNSDRNSLNEATLLAYYDSVVGAGGSVGTAIYNEYVGSTGSAQQRAPGSNTRSNELILKQNTKYILEFTPDSDNCKISIYITWYEH